MFTDRSNNFDDVRTPEQRPASEQSSGTPGGPGGHLPWEIYSKCSPELNKRNLDFSRYFCANNSFSVRGKKQ